MSEFNSSILATALKLPADCLYGQVGGLQWRDYLIAIDRDITAFPAIKYEVSIYSPKYLDWLLLVSPDGYYINFDSTFQALKAGWEWVRCDADAQGNAYPLSARFWQYRETGLSNGMALYLIGNE